MPRNPHKRPCQVPGCKAWAKRGEHLCSSHLASRAIGGDAARVLPLLRLTANGDAASAGQRPASHKPGEAPLPGGQDVGVDAADSSDLAVIDEELRQLLEARSMFMSWLRELRASEARGRPAVTPTQFLRAWSDSTTRVVQLLRARAELRGGEGGAFDALMDSIYAELDGLLPAAPDAPEVSDGDHAR